MGKNDFLTPKAMGLEELRWDCHTCEKQCRDENSFQCHCLSESHQRHRGVYSRESWSCFYRLRLALGSLHRFCLNRSVLPRAVIKKTLVPESSPRMDKSWVHLDRRSPEYYAGLKLFLDGAPKSYPGNEIVCPCIRCKNRESFDRRTVEQHLVVKGMWPFYMNTRWKEHGESYAEYRDKMELQNSGRADIDGMQEFLNETFVQPTIGENVGSSSQPHIFEGPTPEAEKFYKLLEDANKEVYPGCKKFKKLEAVVRLYQLKCLGGLSDNIFSKLLEFIKELLPEGECLPDSFYQTKKLINELGLKYEKIDACPNDCMLFWRDRANLKVCSHCGTSRYIQKESENSSKPVSAKVLRYFPLTPRLQRLYMSKHTALDMRWHATECPKDGFMRHPSDSPAWKQLDLLYPEFGSESRNVRLGLASDGFNPFGR